MVATSKPDSDNAIDIRDAAKTYKGKVQALRGIEMRVHRGEVFGLLGPNGAGKSTLVKILMTVIRPTRVEGTVLGRRVGEKSTLANVGYLPEHHKFPDYLTGGQALDYYGALAGVPRAARQKRSAELLELVGMTDWRKKKVGGYSKGMRQRLGIAQALMNDPDLVLLDEPTDGVDPVGRRDIRNVLTELKSRGKTVFVNSHLLSELEMVCDRVAILVQGVVASQGTIDELTTQDRRYDIELTDAIPPDAVARLRAVLPADVEDRLAEAKHKGLPAPEAIVLEGRTLRVATSQADDVQAVLRELLQRGAVIASVRPVRPSLEDLFMRAVTDPATGEAFKPGASRETGKKGGAQ
ncbi:MAG: ABC transporter ATP-binding protein [Phycisphaerales bacterium]|nr:MAG: ABC transporter ATP-binding protein [Phycisphaerales bacterium]